MRKKRRLTHRRFDGVSSRPREPKAAEGTLGVAEAPGATENLQLMPAPLSIDSLLRLVSGSGWREAIARHTSPKPPSMNPLPPVIGNHCSMRPRGELFALTEQPTESPACAT